MTKSKRQSPRTAERRSTPAPDRGPAVSAEERRKLATCCAFFKAEQYREADPGSLRESDVEIAESAISETIASCYAPRRRGSKTPR